MGFIHFCNEVTEWCVAVFVDDVFGVVVDSFEVLRVVKKSGECPFAVRGEVVGVAFAAAVRVTDIDVISIVVE